MNLKGPIAALLLMLSISLTAQELACRVTVNADKVDVSLKETLRTLEEKLNSYINDRQWSQARFASNERIVGTINIIVNRSESPERFQSEIQVQSSRPVFNASYTTSSLNHRDVEFDFNFSQFQNMEYNQNSITDNLTAVITYYIYIILGMDFDSFSPMGGTPYFEAAMNIVNLAQSMNEKGWQAFQSTKNRYELATALLDPASAKFREFTYIYNRKGLDEMALNIDKGRQAVTASIGIIADLHQARPASPLLSLFADTKLAEIANLYSKAPREEKETVYKVLSAVYPSRTSQLDALKQ